MRRFALMLEIVLFLAALAALGYCAFVWIDSRQSQDQALQQLQQQVPPRALHGKKKPPPPEGTPVGEIVIPRLGLSVAVLEGTGDQTLRRAVGHVPGTAEPGSTGNICLAGHRDTYFRPLRNVVAGDDIVLNFPGGSTRFRVEKAWTVEPAEVGVLSPTTASTLTLITCYPFNFIGSAPERFVVRARAIQTEKAHEREQPAKASQAVRDTRYEAEQLEDH